MNRGVELLLWFAGGGQDIRQSYFVMYHVTASGEVVIHSCEPIFGNDSTLIRFKRFDGTIKEVDVSDKAIEVAIEAFVANKESNCKSE